MEEWQEGGGTGVLNRWGKIEINRINDCECQVNWEYHTLILVIKDLPGAIGNILENVSVNISNLYLKRIDAIEKIAVAIVETDEEVKEECLEAIEKNSYVLEFYHVGRDEDAL